MINFYQPAMRKMASNHISLTPKLLSILSASGAASGINIALVPVAN